MKDAPASPACTAPTPPSTSKVSAAATTWRVGAVSGGLCHDLIPQCSAEARAAHPRSRRCEASRAADSVAAPQFATEADRPHLATSEVAIAECDERPGTGAHRAPVRVVAAEAQTDERAGLVGEPGIAG